MTHELNIKPTSFKHICEEKRTFDVRKYDKPYKVGDTLIFKEYDGLLEQFTGRSVKRKLVYLFEGHGQYGLTTGYVVLGFRKAE